MADGIFYANHASDNYVQFYRAVRASGKHEKKWGLRGSFNFSTTPLAIFFKKTTVLTNEVVEKLKLPAGPAYSRILPDYPSGAVAEI